MTTILVIEDELLVRENILDLLEVEDFTAIGAATGEEGVQMALQCKPDLILCDVMMPKLDGYGVLKALRQHPATADTPFIFLSAKADQADRREGIGLGANAYITKPFEVDELLNTIRLRLEQGS